MKKLFPVIRQFLILFIPSFVMISVITGSIFWGHRETERRLLFNREASILRLHEKTIQDTFSSVVTDLLFLSGEETLQDLLEKKGAVSRGRLAREWSLFAERRGAYDQISYIDSSGMEVVRINRSGRETLPASPSELRDRAGTACFRESLPLARGWVLLFPSDLIAGKDTSDSLRQVLRFATPVFDRQGRKRGILVLSYRGAELFSRIMEIQGLQAGRVVVVTSAGRWLKGLNTQGSLRAGNDFPRALSSAWGAISGTESGEVTNDTGLFVFTTLYPLKEGRVPPAASSGGGALKGYSWKIISYVPAPVLSRLRIDVMARYFILYFLILTLLGIGAWVVSRELQRERELAETDPLTGILNRRKFYSRMEAEIERSHRYGRPLSLLMLDIDFFKKINDTYGHATGDRVLQTLVSIVRRHIRKMDVFARYGGEEFVVLCPETNIWNATILAERLRSSVEEAGFGQAGTITVSFGAAQLKEKESGDDLIRRADDALYDAKQRGRNRVETAET